MAEPECYPRGCLDGTRRIAQTLGFVRQRRGVNESVAPKATLCSSRLRMTHTPTWPVLGRIATAGLQTKAPPEGGAVIRAPVGGLVVAFATQGASQAHDRDHHQHDQEHHEKVLRRE